MLTLYFYCFLLSIVISLVCIFSSCFYIHKSKVSPVLIAISIVCSLLSIIFAGKYNNEEMELIIDNWENDGYNIVVEYNSSSNKYYPTSDICNKDNVIFVNKKGVETGFFDAKYALCKQK